MLYEFSTTVRPLIFSNIFFLYLFNTLLKYNPKSKPFYFLPVIFLLWSNMHADFIIGLAIMIFFALHAVKKPYFKQVALILVLSFLATLVGPYGIQLWKTLILEANPEIISFQEFSPTYIQPIGTLIIGSGIILFIYLFKKENLNWFTFVLIGSFLLGVEAIYFMRIYLMACLVILDQIFSSLKLHPKALVRRGLLTCTVTMLLLILTRNIYLTTSTVENWATKYRNPYNAITYLKSNPIKGNMFNHYDWGGFLIWQLPEYKTFIDGRMAAWRDADGVFSEKYGKIKTAPKENADLLDELIRKYNITFALERPGTDTLNFLVNDRAWKIVYQDNVSVIIVR